MLFCVCVHVTVHRILLFTSACETDELWIHHGGVEGFHGREPLSSKHLLGDLTGPNVTSKVMAWNNNEASHKHEQKDKKENPVEFFPLLKSHDLFGFFCIRQAPKCRTLQIRKGDDFYSLNYYTKFAMYFTHIYYGFKYGIFLNRAQCTIFSIMESSHKNGMLWNLAYLGRIKIRSVHSSRNMD